MEKGKLVGVAEHGYEGEPEFVDHEKNKEAAVSASQEQHYSLQQPAEGQNGTFHGKILSVDEESSQPASINLHVKLVGEDMNKDLHGAMAEVLNKEDSDASDKDRKVELP